ncbi:MAG: response regulator transcription factor [Acidobacteriia bacterium]|nr:response regulator transcription factor [Terriglobia bacterium]
MKIRVLLGDDHAFILDGVRAVLSAEYQVVGQANDGRALVEAAERLKPDLVILDISMPLLNGFESAKQILKIRPTTKLIFLSQHLNPAYLRHALKVGASGYVLKSDSSQELPRAIQTVMRGETYITPAFGQDVIDNLWSRTGEVNNQTEQLTDRQREILQLIIDGKGNKEIADLLHVSVKTIEFHRARLMTKLGVRSVAELTKVALQQGLIPE